LRSSEHYFFALADGRFGSVGYYFAARRVKPVRLAYWLSWDCPETGRCQQFFATSDPRMVRRLQHHSRCRF